MSSASAERVVQVNVEPCYPVFIGSGLLGGLGARLAERVKCRRAMVITDENVGPLYGKTAMDSLRTAGFDAATFVVPAGDSTKSLEWVSRIYNALADARIDRTSPLIALGGGVVGDLTGFVAATWVRGVPFVQCATTIEADVDASVGGKTAVNHASGKNMIGAFYQPLFVLIDTATLRTLSDRDFRAGLAESIKHAVIRDADFLAWHEKNADHVLACDTDALGALVEHNVRIKADIVSQDERETSGLRALLNFGHTVGHAIESLMARQADPWRHGEAVAAGMVAAAEISVAAGRLDRAAAERIAAIVDRMKLPVTAPLAGQRDRIISLMQSDKKVAAGKLRFVLADRIGRATLYDDIRPEWIEAGLDRVLT